MSKQSLGGLQRRASLTLCLQRTLYTALLKKRCPLLKSPSLFAYCAEKHSDASRHGADDVSLLRLVASRGLHLRFKHETPPYMWTGGQSKPVQLLNSMAAEFNAVCCGSAWREVLPLGF